MTRGPRFRLSLAHAAVAAALVTLASLVPACGGGSSGAPAQACPNLGDLTCPSPPPSYKTDVEPIIANRCFPCHAAGGVEVSTINLSTYAGVLKNQSQVHSQIESCRMPQPGATPLTVDELTTFIEWLECSAPNN